MRATEKEIEIFGKEQAQEHYEKDEQDRYQRPHEHRASKSGKMELNGGR